MTYNKQPLEGSKEAARKFIFAQLGGIEFALSLKPIMNDGMTVTEAKERMRRIVCYLLSGACGHYCHHFAIIGDGYEIAVSRLGAECIQTFLRQEAEARQTLRRR